MQSYLAIFPLSATPLSPRVANKNLHKSSVPPLPFSFLSGAGSRVCIARDGPSLQRRLIRCTKMSESSARSALPSDSISREVFIVNSAGEKLSGIIDDTESKEVVVLCHGLRSSKNGRAISKIAAALVKSGTSAFRFDFAGNGESEGQFSYGNYWREVEDLYSVIAYWKDQGRQVSAIVGHSKGGDIVLLYASKYGGLSTVINVSGRFDLKVGYQARLGKEGMEKLEEEGLYDIKNKSGIVQFRITKENLQDRLNTDIEAAVCALSKDIRVFTIHGDMDEVVPVGDAHEFAKRIPNHVLTIVKGGTHNFDGTQEELAALVVDFLPSKPSRM